MSRIGLFGGTFDPVHKGHTQIAEIVMERCGLDRVIFIPAGKPPHKRNKQITEKEHRYNMLIEATKYNPSFEVSRFEIDNKGESYTYITAEHFKREYKNDKLYFIIGDEAYALLDTWREPERIKKVADFIVVTRDEITPKDNVIFIKFPAINISSTDIRQCLLNNKSTENMLSENVLNYIKNNSLYKD